MTFKPHEIEFMRQADLGRLATIQRDGTPQNKPKPHGRRPVPTTTWTPRSSA